MLPPRVVNGINDLNTSIPALVNLREFHVDANPSPPKEPLLSFMDRLWVHLGPQIEVLSFSGSIIFAEDVTVTSRITHIVALRELHISRLLTEEALDLVVPFTAERRNTLETLDISIIMQIDVISVLDDFEPFPLLSKFRLEFTPAFFVISPNRSSRHLVSETKFLQNENHILKDVQLILSKHYQDRWSSALVEIQVGTTAWMLSNLRKSSLFLANLESLHISLPFDSSSGIVSEIVQRSSDTLRDLFLLGCRLTYDEISSLVAAFAHRPPNDRLRTLHLKVFTLDINLIDLLANSLPHLRQLQLFILASGPDAESENLYVRPYIYPSIAGQLTNGTAFRKHLDKIYKSAHILIGSSGTWESGLDPRAARY